MKHLTRRALIFLGAVGHAACGDFFSGPLTFPSISSPTTPCTEDTVLRIAGFTQAEFADGQVAMARGESRRLFLMPPLFVTGCNSLIRSVSWTTDDPGVAAFEPASGSDAWLTARAAGSTGFRADVVLLSGRVVRAFVPHPFSGAPVENLRVLPPPAPEGRAAVAAGEITLPAASFATPARAYVEVRLQNGGTVDMKVDWESTANAVSATLCPGTVTPGLGCSPQAIAGQLDGRHKPITGSAVLPPGLYTLWVQSTGPGSEVARYEIGLRP